MPDAAIRVAQGVSQVWTPEHLVPLRDLVRDRHHADLSAIFAALDERLHPTGANYYNVFRAAAEMALMEQVGRDTLPMHDRQALRQLWDALLTAK